MRVLVLLEIDPATGRAAVLSTKPLQDGAGEAITGADDLADGQGGVLPPVADSVGGDGLDRERAYQGLVQLGVKGAGRIVRDFQARRVLAVLDAVGRLGDHVKNPAAWVQAALRRGWNTSG
jgi:hypothetical protein